MVRGYVLAIMRETVAHDRDGPGEFDSAGAVQREAGRQFQCQRTARPVVFEVQAALQQRLDQLAVGGGWAILF